MKIAQRVFGKGEHFANTSWDPYTNQGPERSEKGGSSGAPGGRGGSKGPERCEVFAPGDSIISPMGKKWKPFGRTTRVQKPFPLTVELGWGGIYG